METTLRPETLASLAALERDGAGGFAWGSVFVLPGWLQAWWEAISPPAEPFLRSVWNGDRLLGLAPLMAEGQKAVFLGRPDVCDYQDFIVAPGRERDFFTSLLTGLKERGLTELDLEALRPESAALAHLVPLAGEQGHSVEVSPAGQCRELDLPDSFEGYFALLNGKQRHELRRKFRRLEEAGRVEFRFIRQNDDLPAAMSLFLRLFQTSRSDKSAFLTPDREAFFRGLARNMAQTGRLRLGFLDLNGQPVAAVFGFAFQDRFYLYNNGFEPEMSYLNLGTLCKALSLKAAIDEGLKVYDFLKGDEVYKSRLGGREVPLSRVRIRLA